MKTRQLFLLVAALASLAAAPMVYPVTTHAADAASIQPRDGWYSKALVDFDFVRQVSAGLSVQAAWRANPGSVMLVDVRIRRKSPSA